MNIIKNIESVDIAGERSWLALGVIVSMVVGGSLTAAYLFVPHLSELQWFGVVIIAIVLTIMWITATKDNNQECLRNQKYIEKIKQLPLDTLKKAARSEELSEESRKAIIRFLNENHQGWSLQ